MSYGYYPNRVLCSVLEEMRTCTKTLNFALLPSLIEEAQTLGNRMEAGLDDQRDVARISDELSKLRKERKALLKEIKELKRKAGKDDDE